MPYIATKSRTIAGSAYLRGDVVDTSALSLAKLATLTRVGLLIQQDEAALAGIAAQQPVVVVEDLVEDRDDLCPHCGAGPFRNLQLHITKTHEE